MTPVTQIPVDTLNRQNPYEPDTSADFGSYLRSIAVRLAAEDIAVNRSENRRAALVQNFYRGNQRGTISPFDYSFLPVASKNRGDPRLIHNWIRPMSRAITGQWTLARTDVIVLPLPTNSAETHIAGAAHEATRLAERLQSLIMTETWRQTRAKYAQFTGMNAFYSYWDVKGSIDAYGSRYQPMAEKPVIEMREQAISQGGYQCNDCGHGGPYEEANELQACPGCGSEDLSTEEPQSMQLPVVTGYDRQPIGFLCCRQVPRWQLKWDRMAAALAESSYLLWEFPMRNEIVKEAFPWWKKGSSENPDERGALRTEYELRNQPGNVPSWGASQRTVRSDSSTIRNWWISPCWYQDYRFPLDYQLAVGMEGGEVQYDTVPGGSMAVDKWPTGVFLTMAGADTLGIVDEEKLDHWLISSYDLIPGQIGGDGIEDGIPEQRRLNKAYALKDADMENCAGSGALFNPLYIDLANIPSDPFTASPVKPGTPPGAMAAGDVVKHLERPNLGESAQSAVNEAIQGMQYMLGAGPGVTGQPDVGGLNNSDTATEAMIQSQGAKSSRSPELALASEADCGLISQWLRLFQKHATDQIALPMSGENGAFEWEWFKGSQIPANFLITTRTRGSAPKSDEDLQADFKSALEMVGGVEGLAMLSQQFPQIVEQIEERWGVDFKLNHLGRIATLVRYRVDVMTAELMKISQSGVDPQMAIPMLAQDPRVVPDPEEPHEVFVQKYQEMLLNDECQKARIENPGKIMAIHAMIDLHKQAGVMKAQEQVMTQMAGQAPAIQAQQQMEAQQQNQQAQISVQESEADRKHESSEKAKDRSSAEKVMGMRAKMAQKKQDAGKKPKR